MKRVIGVLLMAASLFAPLVVAAAAREAICHVCRVREGTTHPEPVRATRTHEGVEYGFCAERCAREFAADPAAFLPPTFPRPAPAFAVRDLDGRPITLDSLRGRVVLLDFWATWCAPCLKSMPELEALHRRYSGRGLTVLGVSTDEGGIDLVRKFARARKVTYPIALDDERDPAWAAYRVKAVPSAYLIDREGRIVAQWTGAAPAKKQLEALLAGLLAAAPAAAKP